MEGRWFESSHACRRTIIGQYWYPVNLDKQEYIHPHRLGCGLKLWEQAANHPCVGSALVILLAAMPAARGGCDLEEHPTVGRWAGDRIALVGDYAEDTDLPPEYEASTIHRRCMDGDFLDISGLVLERIQAEGLAD